MGITVVSSAKPAAAGNAASALQPAADSGGTDFSALLGLQLANSRPLDLQLQTAASTEADQNAGTEDSIAGQDPASLLAAAGLLPALMAGANQGIPNQPRPANSESMSAMVGKAAADPSGKLPDPGIDLGSRDLLNSKPDMKGLAESGNQSALDAFLTSKAHGTALADAANIAAEAQPGANNNSNFAATLAAQTAAAAHASQSQNEAAAAAPQISVPLHDSRWAQDFSDKVVWLAKADQQSAQININPPQLGPMHITLNLSGDQASAVFVSPHAEVRQAIQDAMPQLREMLAGAGINLGQANVGAQLPQQNSGTPQQFSDSRRFGSDNAILQADSGRGTTSLPQPTRSGRGMVDLFA